jgi:alpha-beta hydrolase superfamily lysophospholipase/SAM-dependent methyltransferase
MIMWDGLDLFFREWNPAAPTNKALILFHRGHEHSGRFQDVVDTLNLQGVVIYAWDARGHGRSQGKRGYADSFSTYVKDADFFVRTLSQESGISIENMVVMAHSVGAVIAAAWVHDYSPPIRALILAAPAFRVKLYVPFAVSLCRLLLKVKGKENSFLKSYVKSWMLTHDPEQARRYDDDPLIERAISVNILLGLHDTSTRLIRDAGAIRTPTLIIGAGSDRVVRVSAQKTFFDGLSSRTKEINIVPSFYHALFHEKDRHLVLDKARQFILDSFARIEGEPPLLDADQHGYTKDEYDRLRNPMPLLSTHSLIFGAQKMVMNTLGRLSKGIQIGLETGFDSGRSLDYIYQNTAQGVTSIGRLIDRLYLNSVGWKGIRQRKENLQTILRETIEKVHASGRPVRLLDIAAGPGRYVLEVLRSLPSISVTAVLRDYEEKNLEWGQRLAKELQVTNVTYLKGDAFDTESIAQVSPRPTIAIVSGLYELFPENNIVLRSLHGLAQALEEGGYLIYTGQPWHPQLEMIARVLINRNGKPWIMRRRTQAEVDDLIRSVGFQKVGMQTDEFGMFTVSVACLRRNF